MVCELFTNVDQKAGRKSITCGASSERLPPVPLVHASPGPRCPRRRPVTKFRIAGHPVPFLADFEGDVPPFAAAKEPDHRAKCVAPSFSPSTSHERVEEVLRGHR